MTIRLLAIALTLSVAAACGPAEENNHEGEVTPEEDACEHMEEGPAVDATAVAAGEDAESISDSHTRYDLTVPGDPASGVIEFALAEEGEAHFFFDSDVDLTVTDAEGTEVAAEATLASVDACDAVVEGFVYDLGVGTYTLTIDGQASPGMVYVPAEHAHEEGEEHTE